LTGASDRNATILDVAETAGVSAMTVSRVLKGQDGASAATRERVLAAVKALNYRPNSFAQGLKQDRSLTAGVVVPDISNPFFPEIIRGLELVARNANYSLVSRNVVEDPAREEEALQFLLDRRVDGVIICSSRLEEARLIRAIKPHRAVVLINREVPKQLAGMIDIDYRSGTEAVVEHLLAIGRRRIAMASGPLTSHSGRKRQAGVAAAMARHGIELVAQYACTPDYEGGLRFGHLLAPQLGEVDAVICYNDLIAMGLSAFLRERGCAIPDDIAVVGCDDIASAALVSPALTTLRIDKQELGELAMTMLLDRMAGRHTQHRVVIEPDLVVRDSTFPGQRPLHVADDAARQQER
jgi:LacI family transcriptional regulator